MIHYALRCEPGGHDFDGWFRSGEDFDRQAGAGHLFCPVCGTATVGKALMRPAVGTAPEARASQRTATAGAPDKMREIMRQMQEFARSVRAQADYVGGSFAEEARRIHYGEAAERQIYGEASGTDVRALLDEGIAALPLPSLPEDKN